MSLITRFQILILQHPQEKHERMNSAALAHSLLEQSVLKIGLSWPNLKSAWGSSPENHTCGVLYLGSGLKQAQRRVGLEFVNRKGEPLSQDQQGQCRAHLKSFIVLDGSWMQAKALWWRNPWLLKLKRMILTPEAPSLYGTLRREPRRECLSTIEAIGETLTALGEDPQVQGALKEAFQLFLK